MVREYVGGSFTLYDALDMAPEDFHQVFVVAAARKLVELAAIKGQGKGKT